MKLIKDFLSVRNSIFPLIQQRNYIAISTFDENNSLPFLLNHNNQDQIQSPSTNTIISRKIHDEYEIAYVKACEYIEKNQHFFLKTGQKNFNSTYELLGKAVFNSNSKSLRFVKPTNEPPSDFVQEWNNHLVKTTSNKSFDIQLSLFTKALKTDIKTSDLAHLILKLSELPKIEHLDKNAVYTFRKYLNLLDQASLETLQNFEYTNPLEHFQLLYSWFETIQSQIISSEPSDIIHSQIISRKYHQTWTKLGLNFPQDFLEKSMKLVRNYTPEERLFLLYICGFYQHIPESKTYKVDVKILPRYIVFKCTEDWQTWNFLERSLACNALRLSYIQINLRGLETLKESVKDNLLTLPDDIISNRSVSSLIMDPMIDMLGEKMTGSLLFKNDVETICNKYGRYVGRINNHTKIRLTKLIAKSGIDGPYVEDFIKQWTEGLQSTLVKAKQVRSSELKQIYDATKILFEIHYLKMDSHKNNSVLPAVLQAVDRANRDNFDDLRHWISAVVFLARMGVTNQHGVNEFFNHVNQFRSFQKLNHEDFYKLQEEFANYIGLTNRVRSQTSQWVMHEIFQNLAELDYLLEMNFPEYNKTRLDPKIRAKFIKSYNSKFNLDYYMDLLKANRNRQLIYQELVNYYSSNQVFFGPVLPYHASMSEIILCVNKNGEALDIPSEFRSNLESGHQICKPPLSKLALGYQWHCLVMPKGRHYSPSGNLSGYIEYKLDHLQKLGYRVIVMPDRTKLTVENLTKENIKSLLHL